MTSALAGLPLGVASGDARILGGGNYSVVLWGTPAASGPFLIEVSDSTTFTSIITSSAQSANADVPVKVSVVLAEPGTTNPTKQFYFRCTDAAGNVGTGAFRLPGPTGTGTPFRMGVTGDWRGELAPYPAVKNIPAADLDLFVMLGDTIYADYASPAVNIPQCLTPADFAAKHAEVYTAKGGLNALADARSSTLSLSMIDDHEVINDFAGGAPRSSDPRFATDTGALINDTQLFATGINAFESYHPIAPTVWSGTGESRFDGKPDLYRAYTRGPAAVFVLDARGFRDAELPDADITSQTSISNFLGQSFFLPRTMLGKPQLARLKADLLAAAQANIPWKFVLVPEPIQNFGPLAASDRFEGYANERNDLLRFIAGHNIKNVVFIAADVHGTLVNDVTYQDTLPGVQKPTGAFEVTTGAVAFDAPFGPTVAQLAFLAGIPGALDPNVYNNFLTPAQQEGYIQTVINSQLTQLGYSPLGLDVGNTNAQLVTGGWTATTTYGWTQFEIDPASNALAVTTYGVQRYTPADAAANAATIAARVPTVVQKFVVQPKPYCFADLNGDGTRDFIDFDAFVIAFETGSAAGDFNGDGFVDFTDFDNFVRLFEAGC